MKNLPKILEYEITDYYERFFITKDWYWYTYVFGKEACFEEDEYDQKYKNMLEDGYAPSVCLWSSFEEFLRHTRDF